MFKNLRHRRTPSNPTSPLPDQTHSWEGPLHPNLEHAHPQRYQDGSPPDPPVKISPPPTLPPIERVSSTEFETAPGGVRYGGDSRTGASYDRDPRTQNFEGPQRGNLQVRDLHTFSNHPRIAEIAVAGQQRPESAGNGNAGPQAYLRVQTAGNHELASRRKLSDAGQPLLGIQDAEKRSVMSGRRTGTRLPSPPSGSVSTFEPVLPRTGKRMHLLNPMSLLARRRTSQAVAQLSAESLAADRTRDAFNDSFDPRIRGTRVHDFSSGVRRPPPQKIVSTNDIRPDHSVQSSRHFQRSPEPQSQDGPSDESGPWSGGNHTPVFTENFEEEQYPAAGPHVRRASDLSDLPLPKPPYAKGVLKPQDSKLTSKSSEEAQKQYQAARKLSARRPVLDVPPPVPPKADERSEPRRISIDPASTPPKSTSSSRKGRSRNVSEVSVRDGPIPKHMKSTSSRFSFDMIGAAEQERLLEDRHRKKALEKKNSPDGDAREDEFEDDYDYDDMMDDDGLEEPIPLIDDDYDEEDPNVFLEEEIPGVNADLVGEDEGILEDSENIAGLSFQNSSATPISPYPITMDTPRDGNGDAIGFAMTKDSPYPPIDMTRSYGASPGASTSPDSGKELEIQGLGLLGVDENLSPEPLRQKSHVSDTSISHPPVIDEDDMYFDDGLIDEIGDGDEGFEFDESVFDNVDTDEYGRPLKTFSSQPTLYSPPNLPADPSPSFHKRVGPEETNLEPISEVQPSGGLAPQPSVIGKAFSQNQLPMPGLTENTLAAYQEALAAAAFSAAASGKFRRDSIPQNQSPSSQEDPQPDLVPDSSHTSRYEPFSPSYEDDFDYDDALEDDPIIAAANAEALAYDTDGFYGQEFGFYSAPAGEAEYANGGYFGPRGIEGINRSQSGRVVSREPNLTPITERSEYSNRNSMMSISMYGPASVTSPGLAQLAGLLSQNHQDYEGDMSLNALLKLRRGAWGGSQASLHSSTGSPRSAGGAEETSPITQIPPWGHRRANSAFSLVSEAQSEEEEETITLHQSGNHIPNPLHPNPLNPIITTNTNPKPNLNSNPINTSQLPTTSTTHHTPHPDNREPESEITSPPSPIVSTNANSNTRENWRTHKLSRSADSFSYLKEEDPQSPTGERWVLERRRMSELGEEEVLAREVVRI